MISLATKSRIALVPAMVLPCVASLLYFVYCQSTLAQLLYGASKVLMIAWPIGCILILFRKELPKFSFDSWKRQGVLALGILSGVSSVGVMYLLMQTPVIQVMSENIHLIRAKAVQLGFLDHYWSFALFIALGNSLMEEYYWRWFVFGHLRRSFSFNVSMILGSLAFGAHHFIVLSQYFPLQWTIVFGSAVVLAGMFWCFLYEKQKTILGSWISHIIVDFGFLCIGYHFLNQV